MGIYSQEEFKQSHPHSQNVIIPHHIYENTYDESITREEARARIGIPENKFVITAFGKFRNREEIRMVLGSFHAWKRPHKLLLAPRLYPFSRRNRYGKNFLKRWLSRFGYYVVRPLLNRWLHLRAGGNDDLVDSCDLPYYIAASDLVMIPRKDILNSGNIPLAFLYHKVVVGPDTGNNGELLAITGNPSFDPDDREDIVHALETGARYAAYEHGEANYDYAIENMNIKKTGREYAQVYKDAINGR